MTTETIIIMIEGVAIMIIGFVLGSFYCWEITLISFIFSPTMFVGFWAQANVQKRNYNQSEQGNLYAQANALLSELVLNYKTVAAFGSKNTEQIFDRYKRLMEQPLKENTKKAPLSGVFYGYSLNARVFYIGFVFYFGTLVYEYRDYTAEQIFSALNILLMSSAAAGFSAANVPSVAKAVIAAQRVFDVIDNKSTLDARDGKQSRLQELKDGDIKFEKVDFMYPSRPQKVLNQLDLHIPAKLKIALVGGSGCGKSTITNLLLRFYDHSSGKILIDGEPLADYNVKVLRQ